jgi:hypothetical protein
VAGTLSTGTGVAFAEDVTNLGLRVRFAAVISELLHLYLRALTDDKFKSPACSGYPPSPLHVQRIVLMNQIENINLLFQHDE